MKKSVRVTIFGFCLALASIDYIYAQHEGGGGYPFDIPRTRPTTISYQPVVSFPITGISAEAQTRVDTALELAHGFWTFEAERNLREAILLHPEQPLLYALAAFVQTIFGSGDFERGDAYFAEARRHLATTTIALTERERMWFAAIEPLYNANLDSRFRNSAHVELLQKLVERFPDDLEAKAFLALGNWLHRVLANDISDKDRSRVRAATDLLIEDVLTQSPTHPAHHYKIHLWNNGSDDFRALDSARASGPAQPQTAHLWHMPAHIFYNTYDHYYALKQVEIAHRVDHQQMHERQIMPTNVHNYYHNYRDFALGLKANAGQIHSAIDQGLIMLRFGRLDHLSSRYSFLSLVGKIMTRLEQFALWNRSQEIINQGYFDLLSSGRDDIDREFAATKLRQQLRAMTNSNEMFAANRDLINPLLKQLERISNESAANEPSGQRIAAMFEDSRLWYEIALRRASGNMPDVPEYYLTKLEALALTPASQLMLLAQEFGHDERAAAIADRLRADTISKNVTMQLDLLAYYLLEKQNMPASFAPRYREPIETAERNAMLSITPPVSLLDFQGLKIATMYPNVLARIIADAEARHADRLANPPEELRYLEDVDLERMGPANPQHYQLTSYTGHDTEAAEAFASPEPGRYKAYVFAVGTSCQLCNEQLLKLDAAKAELQKLGIDLIAITTTGERAHGIPTLADRDGTLHRMFNIWDGFSDRSLHGIILMNHERTVLWDSVTEHALKDVTFLLEEFRRVIRLSVAPAP